MPMHTAANDASQLDQGGPTTDAAGKPQLDLDLPAQLAEPESQDSAQPVAPDVVRGRMVRSAWYLYPQCHTP